jgi:hypothetical protein
LVPPLSNPGGCPFEWTITIPQIEGSQTQTTAADNMADTFWDLRGRRERSQEQLEPLSLTPVMWCAIQDFLRAYGRFELQTFLFLPPINPLAAEASTKHE